MIPDVVGPLLERLDFNRGSAQHAAGFKEWLHFCVYAPGVDLLANFSSVSRLHGAPGVDRRAVILARADRWIGSVERDPAGQMPSGRLGAQVGASGVHVEDGVYHLRVRPEKCDAEADIQLTPLVFPSPTHNVVVEDGPPINWVVVPRLRAEGWIRVGERRVDFRDAPAYHDHNWGHFRWGNDFAWEWGYCLPSDSTNPFSIVAVRLTNRRRTRVLAQALFLWKGPRQHKIFRGEAVRTSHSGLLRPDRVFKLPRVMSLVRSGSATEIPRRFEMRGERDGDFLEVSFEPNDVAQVVLPNDENLDFTIIHEVQGSFAARGRVRGETIDYGGNGVFEFLGG